MNQNFDKRLDYITEEEYNKLSPTFKQKKSEYHIISREIRKLVKEKTKLQNKLNEVRNELRIKGKIQNELYKELKIINSDVFPTFSITIQNRYNNEYVLLVIKLGKQKSIYLGSVDNVIKKYSEFEPKIKLKNNKLSKTELSHFMRKTLIKMIDFRSENWNQYKITSKDILSELEKKSTNILG